MNLILIRGGYPPVAVGPEDRPRYPQSPRYLQSLQTARGGQGSEAFETLLYGRLDVTLNEVLTALRYAVQHRDREQP